MESLQENTTVIECLGYNKGNHYSVIEREGYIKRNHCSVMESRIIPGENVTGNYAFYI